jgi:hypothetical protein
VVAFSAGQRFTASLLNLTLGASVAETQTDIATLTSTSYTEGFVGGAEPRFAFVAPVSGSVIVHNSSWLDSDGNSRTFLGFNIREGDRVQQGSMFLAATEANSISNVTIQDITAGRSILITGLTPGDTYNISQTGKVSAGTGEYQDRHLAVQPVV